jgi:hypothetical protein
MSRLPLAIGIAVLLLGCAIFQSRDTQTLLDAAGFRIVAANTQEKIQALNNLPAGKISRVDRDGTIYFVYPDAEKCRCLRVGRQAQYDRYKRMATESKSTVLDTTGADSSSGAFKGYEPW